MILSSSTHEQGLELKKEQLQSSRTVISASAATRSWWCSALEADADFGYRIFMRRNGGEVSRRQRRALLREVRGTRRAHAEARHPGRDPAGVIVPRLEDDGE